MGNSNRSAVIRGWLELVRLPNLFTVPGDVLAGASLATITWEETPLVFPVLVISLSLYISGLLLNDYIDRDLDRLDRPERPIPSGRVRPGAALAAALILIALAMILCVLTGGRKLFLLSSGLLVLILLYNGLARKVPVLGFTVMGLCRGSNLLLGAGICGRPFTALVLAGAGIEVLYIASVSVIAAQETTGSPIGLKGCLLFVPLSGLVLIMLTTGTSPLKAGAVLLASGWPFHTLYRDNQPTSTKVGALIRGLIPIQIGLIALSINGKIDFISSSFLFVTTLLVLFPVSGWVGQKFYGS